MPASFLTASPPNVERSQALRGFNISALDFDDDVSDVDELEDVAGAPATAGFRARRTMGPPAWASATAASSISTSAKREASAADDFDDDF